MSSHHAVTADVPLFPGKPVEGEVFVRMCSLSGSAVALAAKLLYEAGEFEQLVRLDFDPFFAEWNNYSPQEFMLAVQAVSFFKKYTGFRTGIDTKRVAFEKWKSVETHCAEVNQIFRNRWDGKQSFSDPVEDVISRARSKIRRVLRDVSQSDVDFIREHGHFGPGADTSTNRGFTSQFYKFSDPGSVTPACENLMSDVFGTEFVPDDESGDDFYTAAPHVAITLADRAKHVLGSRLAFVPKNAKTDRSICVEPRWNIFVQLGIGELISKRLRGYRIDIRDQTRNQNMAQRAGVDRLATIDLSSASDSLSTNLVIDLLADADPLWLDLLLKSRCDYTTYNHGKTSELFRLEKISSMGNGYTFPLETLIFFCLAWSAADALGLGYRVKRDVSVYGDDIIVPSEVATLLIEVLRCVGFSPNREKTFVSGDFYESCGQDYFKGKNVRPFFVYEGVRTVFSAFTLCNQMASFARRFIGADTSFAFGKVWRLRELVIRRIPKSHRLFGPPEAGDGVIHDTFDRARPVTRGKSQKGDFSGYRVKCIKTVAEPILNRYGRPRLFFEERDYYGHLYSKLCGTSDTGNRVFIRDRVRRRLGEVYVLAYTDTIPM